MISSGQPELTIPCRTEDSSEARMERQVKCREKTAHISKIFKFCCCTFIVLISVLILIPIVATEILKRQAEHVKHKPTAKWAGVGVARVHIDSRRSLGGVDS